MDEKELPLILIVDDSSFLRARVRQALQEGYRLVEAASGRAALEAVEKQEFDCILTDLVMPELDGFALLAEFQKRRIEAPIAVLTADIQKSTQTRCAELGARAFVQKPVNREVLRSVVFGMLRGTVPEHASK